MDRKKPGASKGVAILTGSPRIAIIKLSIPMIIAMSIQAVYNLVDGIWVAGIEYGLSAVGFYFPFMLLAVALSVGIGVGGGSAISRFIGKNDKESANQAADHTFIFGFITSIAFTIIFLLFGRFMFKAMGSGGSLQVTVTYANIMFAGSIVFFFNQVSGNILRSEGDANRSMVAMMLGAGLNIVLDPFFIYRFTIPGTSIETGLGLGVAGAAVATVLSLSVTSLLLVYWMFIKKNTWLQFKLLAFRFNTRITMDILKVGLPATLSQASMFIMSVLITVMVARLAGDEGVAVYTSGWRVVMLGILPLLGMGTAVTAVCGASYGAKNYQKLQTSYLFAVQVGLAIEVVIAVIVYFGASVIVKAFTWSEATGDLDEGIIRMLKIMALFFPALSWGILSSALFQGMGHGGKSLLISILRTVILSPGLGFMFGFIIGMGVDGVYWGIVGGTWGASLLALAWALITIIQEKSAVTSEIST
jgi:putative MATE family efflux protein